MSDIKLEIVFICIIWSVFTAHPLSVINPPTFIHTAHVSGALWGRGKGVLFMGAEQCKSGILAVDAMKALTCTKPFIFKCFDI